MRHTLDEHIRGPMSATLWARVHACDDHAQRCKRLSMSLIKHQHLQARCDRCNMVLDSNALSTRVASGQRPVSKTPA